MNDALARALPVAAPVGVAAGAVAAGVLGGLGLATLVLAAGALLGAIAAFWSSLQALSGEAPMTMNEAIAIAHPSDADERKRAILQALKDLDFDFGVGKIAREDYEVLVSRYRQQAKGLLRTADEDLESVRVQAAAYVTKHGQPSAAATPTCPKCRAKNDADAVFCNKCGGRLSPGNAEKADDAK